MLKTVLQTLLICLFIGTSSSLFAQLPPPCGSGTEPAEDCESACISCNFNGYMGSTSGFAAGSVPNFCSQIQNDQWIGFIAGATAATFTVTPSNCTGGNGVQVALYGGCGESFIACNPGGQGNGNVPASISASLIPGTNYYLLIDGYSGDECDFTISISPPSAVQAQPLGPINAIAGPSVVCPGATVTYSVANVTNAGAYTWTVPPGATVNGEPSGTTFDAPGGHTVQVTFGSFGGQVCVEADNSCFQGNSVCKNVQVVPIPVTTLPKVVVCNEDLPYILPWGGMIYASGTYSNTEQSYLGCDSVVRQQIVVKPPVITNLSPKVVCQGECVSVCGQNFCTTAQVSQTCTSYQGCDSLVTFQLTVLNPVAEILGNNLLSCSASSITLNSAISAPGSIKTWKKLDGTILANNSNSVVVFQPGTIILTTTQQQSGVICAQTDTIVITANFSVPTAAASVSGALACQQPAVQLLGTSSTAGALFAWSGPNGFTSNEPSPIAYAAGTYTLVVSHPISHCTATATVEVIANGNVPTITATGGSLSCISGPVTLLTSTTASMPAYSWAGPGNFTSNLPNPNVNLAGQYIVTVTDGITGCLAIAIATVLDHSNPPLVTALGDTLSCAQPTATLSATTNAAVPVFMWTGPSAFTSMQANPTVSEPGIYTLKVTDANTGCTAVTSVFVAADTQQPDVTATGGTLDCDKSPITLQGSSLTPNVNFAWTGPGFSAGLPNPMVAETGTYTLVVTAPNGCTNATSVQVEQVPVPVIGNVQVTNDLNGQGVGAINITVSGSNLNQYNWFLNGVYIANTQDLSGLQAGIYTVQITSVLDTCTTSATIIVDNLVATAEPAFSTQWEIAPNPASTFVNIYYRGDALADARLILFDMLGRKMKEENMSKTKNWQMEVKNLPAGQYQLMIESAGQTALRPVVIQR